jgi:pyruvate/2-oxoglutarate dehydrogenase complex dihydrolipoamide acyltransferase (E2) component
VAGQDGAAEQDLAADLTSKAVLDAEQDAATDPPAKASLPPAAEDDQADRREQAPAAPTSARNLVREDGSMIKPVPRGPLSGLRQRLAS